ncbi:MAG: hypothetical protein WA996_14965 [Candidatus Promineifilaceae bacterium]
MKKRNVSFILVGGILILALALGVTVVLAQTDQDPDTPPDTQETQPFHKWGKGGHSFGRGFSGQLEGLTPNDELIADELGVTVEDLQGAYAAAFEAASEDGAFGFPGHRGFDKDGEYESYLEDALADIGVTIDELKAAQEAVKAIRLGELVEEGYLTEDQLSMMEAQQALKEYIDPEALMTDAAEALGIELPDPKAALEEGFAPWALMEQLEEQGITIQDVMDAVQAAYENAISQAVVDGVIDGDQAELILENSFGGMLGFGGTHSFGGMRGFGGMHDFDGMESFGGMRGFKGHDCDGMQGFHGGGFRGFGPANGNSAPTGISL